MEWLHLDNNALRGTIPDNLTSMSRLSELWLSHNFERVVGTHCKPSIWDYKKGDTVCCYDAWGKFDQNLLKLDGTSIMFLPDYVDRSRLALEIHDTLQ